MFCRYLPINTEAIIENRNTSICLRMIEVITLVLEDCCFREDSETMGKALWDKELDMIIFCQLYSYMLAISRRAFTNIHCYIEYSTLYAAHQLTLSIWWTLEMQASHYTITTHRLVVLAEVNTVSQDRGNLLFKLSLAEALEEIASSIAEEAWLYNEYAIYIGFDYIHCFCFNFCSYYQYSVNSNVIV